MATVNWDSGYRKTLTIAQSATSSDVINMSGLGARRKMTLTVMAPETLPETVTLEVADTPTGTFKDYERAGEAVTFTAGAAERIDSFVAGAVRLTAGGAATADRVFILMGNTSG